MILNNKIKEIINKLEKEGYETYVVGGSCRDEILEIPNKDFDLVTTASLEEIKEVLDGENFVSYQKGLTVGVIYNKSLIDISTTNGLSIKQDVDRRDFTMNTLLYHPIRGWIDYLNGQNDIINKLIKSVKKPDEIIENDPLRILRAIRFEASLNFKIDNDLFTSMFKNKELLKTIAVERIKDEFSRILLVDTPSSYLRKYIDIFDVFIPGLKKCENFNQKSNYHHLSVLDHILNVVDVTKNNLILRLAALLHDIKKPDYFFVDEKGNGHFYGHDIASAEYSKKLLKSFKYSAKDVERVYKLIKFHDYRPNMTEKNLLKFLNSYGTDDLDLLFSLKRADVIAQNPLLIERINDLDIMEKEIYKLIETKKYITKENLNISAQDLIEIGYPKDKTISLALNKILEEVKFNNLENNKDILINYARTLLS